jgi:hypothetical protein
LEEFKIEHAGCTERAESMVEIGDSHR